MNRYEYIEGKVSPLSSLIEPTFALESRDYIVAQLAETGGWKGEANTWDCLKCFRSHTPAGKVDWGPPLGPL